MQVTYRNTDGSLSLGTLVGTGVRPQRIGFMQPMTLRPTVQVRFVDTDEMAEERVETLFADDYRLRVGVLAGTMLATLRR